MLSGQVLGRRAAEGRARGLRSAWAGPSVWVARWAARRRGPGRVALDTNGWVKGGATKRSRKGLKFLE